MKASNIGDQARSFGLLNQASFLRDRMERLTRELNTGRVDDVMERLRGDFAPLSAIEHRLKVMEGYDLATTEAAGFTSAVQAALTRITDGTSQLGVDLLSLGASSPGPSIGASAQRAADQLQDMLSALNQTWGGRSVFSGVATDTAPMADAATILAAVRGAATGSVDATDAYARIDAWFSDPAGFASIAYQGATIDLAPFRVAETTSVELNLRADDLALRNALRDTVVAALSSDPALGLTALDQVQLMKTAAQGLSESSDRLIELQGRVGYAEERIETAGVRQKSENLALQSARNDLVLADPFETAISLEAVQTRLETLYAVTVRSSQLTLANFLR